MVGLAMTQKLLVCVLSLALLACGGGGGGNNTASQRLKAGIQTASDGSSRQVNGPCPFNQLLGAARADGLRISRVSLLQTVGQDAGGAATRLVAGKATRVRVDILAASARSAPTERKLLAAIGGACTTLALDGPSSVPVSSDDSSLSGSYVATIPAELVQPGLTLTVVVDNTTAHSVAEADQLQRIYSISVAPAVSETLRIIPLVYQGVSGYVTLPATLADLLGRVHPLTTLTLTSGEASFAPPSLNGAANQLNLSGQESTQTMSSALAELDQECMRRNGHQRSAATSPKCLGVFPDNLSFVSPSDPGRTVVGLAYIGGTTMMTQSVSRVDVSTVTTPYAGTHWLDFRAVTVAHEFGHLLNLGHADCGGPSGIDSRLHADGRLDGGSGYDSGRDFFFSSAGDRGDSFGDLMSYCSKEWPSDRGYLAALDYRAQGHQGAAGEQQRWLRLRQNGQGWQADPVSFAPATLVASPLQLLVHLRDGQRLLPVRRAVIADLPAGSDAGTFYVDLGQAEVLSLALQGAEGVLSRWPGGILAK